LKVLETARPERRRGPSRRGSPNKVVDIRIREGEIFLLPPRVPHSPRRPAGTVGLVIERKRLARELDGLKWICEKCHRTLYEEFFRLKDIVKDLPPVFDRFYSDEKKTTCGTCGWKNMDQRSEPRAPGRKPRKTPVEKRF
jgi:hypothetical protein